MDSRSEKLNGSAKLHPARIGCPTATARRASFPALLTLALGLAILALVFAGSAEAVHCKGSPAPRLDWSDCDKSRLVLWGSDLEGANLFGTDFTLTDLRDANLKSANLEKARLVRTWLAGSNAQKANFTGVEAYRTDFVGMSAEGASFASAELQRADFSRARLAGA